MLVKGFVLGAFLVLGVRCDFYNDLRLFGGSDPYNLDFTRPFESRPVVGRFADELDVSASEQKPVLEPKQSSTTTTDVPTSTTSTSSGRQLPEGIGVIDVDANGFAAASPFKPEFDFSSTFGLRPLSFGDLFSGINKNQWWKGKNVCVEREESTDDEDDDADNNDEDTKNSTSSKSSKGLSDLFSTSISLSNCFEVPNKYECVTKVNNHGVVKTFTVRYKCCYGYKRANDGCTKTEDLKPMMDTLESIKTTEFLNLIKNTGLEKQFSEGNYSLFVPTDEALNEYNEKINEMNRVDNNRRRRGAVHSISSKDLVLSHAVEGFVDLNDVSNDEVLRSESNNSTIRINVYPTHTQDKLVTANCARVSKPNVFTENGIVQVTDAVVVPANEDIQTIIKSHPRLTSFAKAIENTDIPSHMKLEGHYTVFAPTDEAFHKLDEVQKQKIISGDGCAGSILKHHFTAHTICSSAIVGNATTHNVEGEVLNLERTADDDLIFENKAKIVETDIVATNGVIHLIDEIVIPDSGLYIGSVLKNQNFTKFQDMVEKAGMKDEINGLQNATVFVPANKAFETEEGKKLLEAANGDPEQLREIVKYHIVQGQLQSSDMNNNVMLDTKDEGKQVRINLYSTLPLFTNIINRATINCVGIIGFDEKACGSVIHEVGKVLVPPTKNILEIINSDDKYSTLRTILKDTEVEKILQENNRSITFLAPTDETFAALDERDKKLLLENKEKANTVLKNHVLSEVLCCAGVGPQSWGFSSFVSTLNNNQVEVSRTGTRVRINRAVVTSCDNLATNGVIHTINRVLLPRQPQVGAFGGGLFFFDL